MTDDQENHFIRQMLEVKDRELKAATQKISDLENALVLRAESIVKAHSWAISYPARTIDVEDLVTCLEGLLKGVESERGTGLQRTDDDGL